MQNEELIKRMRAQINRLEVEKTELENARDKIDELIKSIANWD